MVKQFILMILLCGVSSCYPPRIVYALDEMHSIKNNSIDYKKGHLLKLFLLTSSLKNVHFVID